MSLKNQCSPFGNIFGTRPHTVENVQFWRFQPQGSIPSPKTSHPDFLIFANFHPWRRRFRDVENMFMTCLRYLSAVAKSSMHSTPKIIHTYTHSTIHIYTHTPTYPHTHIDTYTHSYTQTRTILGTPGCVFGHSFRTVNTVTDHATSQQRLRGAWHVMGAGIETTFSP